MQLKFSEKSWADYNYWQTQDRKTLKRLNNLIEDIMRNGYDGIGKPEALSGNLWGYWSRRIDETNRLIYRLEDNNSVLNIYQCKGHCDDK